MNNNPKDRIIIALDVGTRAEALRLVGKLEETKIFKVGLQLYTAEGPDLVRGLHDLGKKVFLDLKLHDIPNTVAGAVKMGIRLGVNMMTLHASGGLEMMSRAAAAAEEEARITGNPIPLLLAVTVLTSLREEELNEIGVPGGVEEQVLNLAGLAVKAGIKGVVCSPKEIELVKKAFPANLSVVAPGIRPKGAAAQDQKRILTPAEAVQRGADYLVVGRPVTQAPSPRDAFLRIVEELETQ